MKKIIYILTIFTLIFSSCKDYLDIDPANIKTIQTVDDVKGILGGYLKYQISPMEGASGMPTTDEKYYADMRFFPNLTTQRLFLYQSDELNSLSYPTKDAYRGNEASYAAGVEWKNTSAQEKIWNNSYETIGFMNSLLLELNDVEGSANEKNFLKAEIKLQRAWHIFKLLQYFAPYNNNKLGIPLNLDADKVTGYDQARKPQTEVYKILIKEAEEVLSYNVTPEEYHVFYSPEFVNAFLAKIYWFKALSAAKESTDWSKAREYAIKAMEGRELATDAKELAWTFKDSQQGVVKDHPYTILKFSWPKKASANRFWGSPDYRRMPWYPEKMFGILITDELYSMYDTLDIRVSTHVLDYDKALVSMFKETLKYYNRSQRVAEVFVMFRIADLHLIVAESYAREGDQENAIKWLNDFKTTRNATLYTEGDLIEAIMTERRKEFVTEFDMRWLDMKRTGVSYSRPFIVPSGEQVEYTIESDDYRYSFFIPESTELSYNKRIKQNPGWSVAQ